MRPPSFGLNVVSPKRLVVLAESVLVSNDAPNYERFVSRKVSGHSNSTVQNWRFFTNFYGFKPGHFDGKFTHIWFFGNNIDNLSKHSFPGYPTRSFTFVKAFQQERYAGYRIFGICSKKVNWSGSIRPFQIHHNPSSFSFDDSLSVQPSSFSGLSRFLRLLGYRHEGQEQSPCGQSIRPSKESIPIWRVPFGLFYVAFRLFSCIRGERRWGWALGILCGGLGMLFILGGYVDGKPQCQQEQTNIFQHNSAIVPRKYLDSVTTNRACNPN